MKADLHLHTTASDGTISPDDMVRLAVQKGIQVIAITDHDTVNGIDAALAVAHNFPSLIVIPGVEINTDIPHGEVHVLGFFIDYRLAWFEQKLRDLRESRRRRAQRMLEKLSQLGMPLEWHRIEELARGGAIGRPHVALAMQEKGYVRNVRQAFDLYIGRDGPAYVEREKLSPVEAVELVASAGGLPALSHPADIENLESLLDKLIASGLVALEAYYPSYSPEVTRRMLGIAQKRDLIPCGGSDFHGLDSQSETPVGGVYLPQRYVEQLLARSGKIYQKRFD